MSFTFNFTKEQLKEMIPRNPYVDQWYEALHEILPEYEITTPHIRSLNPNTNQETLHWVHQCQPTTDCLQLAK